MAERLTVTYQTGETVWDAGELETPLLIRRGALLMTSPAERQDTPLALFLAGHVVLPHPAAREFPLTLTRLVAVTQCEVEPLDFVDTRCVATEVLAVEMMVLMASWLGGLLAPQRAARILLQLHDAQAVFPGEPKRWLHCRQDVLALAIGIRRETLSAMYIQAWRDAEIIETRYRKIRVLDVPALRRIAGLSAESEASQ